MIRGLVEQWPKQLKESGRSEKDEDFPRNASGARLREVLQRHLEAWHDVFELSGVTRLYILYTVHVAIYYYI